MAHDANSSELPFVRLESWPAGLRNTAIGLTILGAVVFGLTLVLDASRAWHAYLVNWLFFMSIAQGAVMFAVLVTITRGMWSRPIRRIALGFVAFLPVAYVLMLPMLFAADHIFP
ncbi:MAG: hypothetical protein L0271_02245, partial [Gemmatimonadetes bacterium]|nr:hypothetical protein [Gemmatimonadota bacterium]